MREHRPTARSLPAALPLVDRQSALDSTGVRRDWVCFVIWRWRAPLSRSTSPCPGQTVPQQRATHLAKNHNASETKLTPLFGQKKTPGGVKRWPSSGLAGDFRHLPVGWQPSRAAMRMFCFPVKSSEL